MPIKGGRPFGGFNKPTSDGSHEGYQADERRSDSRYNHHWDNPGASIFEAAYVAKKETQ